MNDEHKQILFKHGATLSLFTSQQQMNTITDLCFGEEGQFFLDKLKEYGERIATMPKTYEQDGKGFLATAYLHYFIGGCDWYITEKDKGDPSDEKPGAQLQAFGMARTHPGDSFELGYISIEEITRHGAELDLHFTLCTLDELREKHDRKSGDEEPQQLDEDTLAELAAAFSDDGKEVAP